jgi:hypothetical protein
MLSGYLVRLVEQLADRLTDELVEELLRNPRTTSFRKFSADELHHRIHSTYRRLTDWLADADDARVESKAEELGSFRFREGVPLSEFVYALTLTKHNLRSKIRLAGNTSTALALHNELELNTMIGRYFDMMLYGVVQGYEHARFEHQHPARSGTQPKAPLGTSPAKIDWVP